MFYQQSTDKFLSKGRSFRERAARHIPKTLNHLPVKRRAFMYLQYKTNVNVIAQFYDDSSQEERCDVFR